MSLAPATAVTGPVASAHPAASPWPGLEPLEQRTLMSVVFPTGTVINITTAYNVTPNDGVDDTAEIQRAISENVGKQFGTRVLYFPDGVYNISDTLKWVVDTTNNSGGKRYFTMQGQSKAGTIFRLANNAAGFTSASSPKVVIDTAVNSANNNVAFYSHVKDFTIDTGSGNAGAIGLNYIASNMGSIRNVKVVSSDPNKLGKYGFAFTKSWPGPFMVSGCEVVGLDVGFQVNQTQYSVSFEDITLSGQRVAGMSTASNGLWVRDLTSTNTVPALRLTANNGMVVLTDANLTGGSATVSAVESSSTGGVLLRNVTTSGYQSAVKHNGTVVSGANQTHWTSHPTESLFTSPTSSLNLPVQETPTFNYTLADVAVAANVAGDDTASIQNALNSGKPVVMLACPPAGTAANVWYNVSGTLTVPATVKRIIGNYQSLSLASAFPTTQPLWHFTGGNFSHTTILENFNDGYGSGNPAALQQHDDQRTLVIKDAKVEYRTTISNPGNVFLDDTVGGGPDRTAFPVAPGQKVWARQFNVEDNNDVAAEPLVRNNGGDLWILGMKTEGAKTAIVTQNGGKTELLGAFIYPVAAQPSDLPIFVNNESSFSGAWMTNGAVNTQVRETRGGVTLNLLRADVPQRGTGTSSTVPMYTGYQQGLPAGWSASDIGAVGAPGSTTKAGSAWTVRGAGTGLAGGADEAQFAYTTLTGDGYLVARVTAVQNVSASSFAGVSLRATLAANSQHHTAILQADGQVKRINRNTTGSTSTYSANGPLVTAPYWLKVERTGNTLRTYASPDGAAWTQLFAVTQAGLPSTMYVGLIGSSKVDATAGVFAFDNVSLNGSSPL